MDSGNIKSQAHRKRLLSLDIARGLAVIFMIMQHSMIIYGSPEATSTFLGEIIVLLGTAPAAPVFMVLMGIFFIYSRKDFKSKLLRGFSLLMLGYILNFVRFTLPVSIALFLYSFHPVTHGGHSPICRTGLPVHGAGRIFE